MIKSSTIGNHFSRLPLGARLHFKSLRPIIVLFAIGSLMRTSGLDPVIGTAIGGQGLQVDRSLVPVGVNPLIFEGTTIENHNAPVLLMLKDKALVLLDTKSRAKVYANHLLLEQGKCELRMAKISSSDPGKLYQVQATGLRISPGAADITAMVSLKSANSVQVEALHGAMHVTDRNGTVLADITSGKSLVFGMASDSLPGAYLVRGILENRSGNFILKDEISGITVQLRNADMRTAVGSRIEVTGNVDDTAKPVSGASQVVLASKIKRLSTQAVTVPVSTAAAAQTQLDAHTPVLRIAVIDGEGAINNIRQRVAREPSIELTDEKTRPIRGAEVIFQLPKQGPSGVFGNSSTTLTVTTAADGRARGQGLQPNDVAGAFQILVSASYGGRVSSATITQINSASNTTKAEGAAVLAVSSIANTAGMSTGTKVIIAGVIVGAAATSTGLALSKVDNKISASPATR